MFSLPTLIHACHIVNNLPRISLPFPLPLFLVFIFMPGKKYKRNIWIEYSWRAILFIWLHPTFLSFSFVLVGKFRAITMFFLPFNFFPSSIVGFFVFWFFFLSRRLFENLKKKIQSSLPLPCQNQIDPHLCFQSPKIFGLDLLGLHGHLLYISIRSFRFQSYFTFFKHR